MQRIGIDVRLTYYRQGGIAEYMRQLTSALAKLPANHHFLGLHNFRAAETLPLPRVNCYTPCHHRFEAFALGMELLPRRLDLLHSPDFIPPRLGAKKYVITVHDLAFLLYQDLQTPDSLRYYAGQIQRAVQQADRIIAVSHATKADLIRLLDVPAEKISVIWEGLHPAFQIMERAAAQAALAPYQLPADYLLFVGTLEPRKNLPNLLQAYALLKSRRADVPPLVLAGQKGWLVDDLLSMIQDLGVIWLEKVPHEILPALYNGARLHVLPSLYEGFGFPPLEAMACGTPTVISNRGSLPEIAGKAAGYFEPDQPESIAAAIQQLLEDNTLYQQQREQGLEHIKQFTWQAAAIQTLEVYQQVLAQ